MKRLTALLLAVVMLLSLTACGGSAPVETEVPAAALSQKPLPSLLQNPPRSPL